MPQRKDETTNRSKVTSPGAIPQLLTLPGRDEVLLKEVVDLHGSVKKLFALLDLLDRPEGQRGELGERLMAILADTRDQVQILVERVNELMEPETGIRAELDRLRAAQDRTGRMVEKILVLLGEPVD